MTDTRPIESQVRRDVGIEAPLDGERGHHSIETEDHEHRFDDRMRVDDGKLDGALRIAASEQRLNESIGRALASAQRILDSDSRSPISEATPVAGLPRLAHPWTRASADSPADSL